MVDSRKRKVEWEGEIPASALSWVSFVETDSYGYEFTTDEDGNGKIIVSSDDNDAKPIDYVKIKLQPAYGKPGDAGYRTCSIKFKQLGFANPKTCEAHIKQKVLNSYRDDLFYKVLKDATPHLNFKENDRSINDSTGFDYSGGTIQFDWYFELEYIDYCYYSGTNILAVDDNGNYIQSGTTKEKCTSSENAVWKCNGKNAIIYDDGTLLMGDVSEDTIFDVTLKYKGYDKEAKQTVRQTNNTKNVTYRVNTNIKDANVTFNYYYKKAYTTIKLADGISDKKQYIFNVEPPILNFTNSTDVKYVTVDSLRSSNEPLYYAECEIPQIATNVTASIQYSGIKDKNYNISIEPNTWNANLSDELNVTVSASETVSEYDGTKVSISFEENVYEKDIIIKTVTTNSVTPYSVSLPENVEDLSEGKGTNLKITADNVVGIAKYSVNADANVYDTLTISRNVPKEYVFTWSDGTTTPKEIDLEYSDDVLKRVISNVISTYGEETNDYTLSCTNSNVLIDNSTKTVSFKSKSTYVDATYLTTPYKGNGFTKSYGFVTKYTIALTQSNSAKKLTLNVNYYHKSPCNIHFSKNNNKQLLIKINDGATNKLPNSVNYYSFDITVQYTVNNEPYDPSNVKSITDILGPYFSSHLYAISKYIPELSEPNVYAYDFRLPNSTLNRSNINEYLPNEWYTEYNQIVDVND